MKRLSALCLVFVVVLAGCTGGGGDGPTTPSPTQTGGDTPPGISEAGVDAETLLFAHEQGLTNRSYTLLVDQQTTDSELAITAKASADRLPAVIELAAGGAGRETYITTDGSYELRHSGGEQITRQVQANASAVPTGAPYIRNILAGAQFSYEGTVQTEGRTLHRLSAGQTDLQREVENASVVDYEAELLVGADGIVYNTTSRLTLEQGGEQETYTTQIRVADVGATTVEEPAWVDTVDRDSNTTTRLLSNTSIGTSISVAGTPRNVTSVRLGNASTFFYDSSVVEPARVTPVVAMQTNRSVSFEGITMEYDMAAVPDGNASGLFVFVYHPSFGSLVPMETSFDPTNETVRATRIDPRVTITVDDEPTTPSLDGLTGGFVFVTMHGQTYQEALEEAETS